jgi:NAD(P)-dependent dehydrogenase (short-subunit alcohol dehydrogenase family)
VIATGRDQSRLDQLRERFGSARLSVTKLDALTPQLASDAWAIHARHGSFAAVVVAIGSWGDQGRKPALELTDGEWDDLIAANQTAVFRLYREFLPFLANNGALVQLNGMSADIPFPGSAGVALTAAATKSLTRTIAAELGGRGPRVYEVVLGVIRTRTRQRAGIDDPSWIDATEVGTHVSELVAATSPLSSVALHYFAQKKEGPRAGTDSY